jgi:membrane-bound lytic murein transglycosylase D
MARAYPEIRNTEEFKQVLNSLTELESFTSFASTEHQHMVEMDSLALATEQWPEGDEPQMDPTPAFTDTVFPHIESDRIEFWVRYFTGPGKERFERTLYRMQLHRPTVERILAEQDLPLELIAVPLIESGFVMHARSYARAVGPWQFISGTARIYGLRMDWWYDERRDIVAATYAATNYLKDLHGIWQDWPLALAAYNCGEYRVARAVARHKTTNFWKLRLPKQTERYVPKFLAALYILRDPEKHGFTMPEVEPITFDEITIKDATDLRLIAKGANTTVDVIKDLNPSLLQWATPPRTEIHVKVPPGTGETCAAELAKIPPEERITWRKHKIRTGETLSVIARKYRTTASALKSLNGLRSAHRIRAGHHLIVPMQGGYTEVAGTTTSKPEYMTKRRNLDKSTMDKYAKRFAPPANHKQVTYVVKDRDTLGEIAEWFRTRASKIRSWNNLSYRSYIYPGQKLVIYVPDSFDVSAVPRTTDTKPSESDYVRQTHTVRKGDTIYSISKRYNVRVSDVLAWNSKRSSRIYPGQTLEIWKKKD